MQRLKGIYRIGKGFLDVAIWSLNIEVLSIRTYYYHSYIDVNQALERYSLALRVS